jgi:hypothetical protein
MISESQGAVMKKILLAALICLFSSGYAFAGGGLDSFLSSLNVEARADMNGFSARISAQFGVPQMEVRTVLARCNQPADAFMVFQLGQMTQRPPATVLQTYQKERGRGWGVIAKDLGIKPGSPEFHALKRGDFRLEGRPGDDRGHGRGNEHGHGNGNGHGHGHGHDKDD